MTDMRLRRPWRLPFIVALCAAGWFLPGSEAAALPSCTATMSALAFGDVDLVSGGTKTANATLNWSCFNDQSGTRYFHVCFDIGQIPRALKNTSGQSLPFQLYQGATQTIWGSEFSTVYPDSYDLTFGVAPFNSFSGTYTLRGEIPTGQAATAPGSYTLDFAPNHTALVFVTATSPSGLTACSSSGFVAGRFSFIASANVLKSCLVTADPLDFGTVDGLPSSTNVDASSAIRVNCSSTTAYAVRLLPSNNNTNGSSTMKGQTAGNTDAVPYRLYSNAARSTAWGNLSTNDVEATGNGTDQTLTVYGRVPGLPNVRPDNYKDTVTVSVVY